jgi:hypothetical protein
MDTNASVSLLKEDLAGRIRVPAAKRLQILEEFDRSGMSGLAFAALVGVKYQTFASWRRRRVSDGLKTDETCRFEKRVRVGGRKTPSEGCSDGGAGLDWEDRQGGLIWSLVR